MLPPVGSVKFTRSQAIGILTLFMYVVFVVFLLPITLIAITSQRFVWMLGKIFRPELDSLVTGEISIYAGYPVTMARKNTNILVVLNLKGDLSQERVQDLCRKNIFENVRNKFVYQRLRQTWTSFLGFAFWMDCEDFDVKNHVRDYDYYDGNLALPIPCSFEHVLEKVLDKYMELPWKESQSPWEILVKREEQMASFAKTYCFLKIHHILGDGYSILKFLEIILGTEFSLPKSRIEGKQISSWDKASILLNTPYDIAEGLVSGVSGRKFCRGSAADGMVISVSPTIPVQLVKGIKNRFGVSYAAVLYSALQGAIARALKEAKMAPLRDTAISFVMPKPNHPGGMVLHAIIQGARLPCETSCPVERLLETHKRMDAIMSSTSGNGLMMVLHLLGYYPVIVRRALLSSFTTNFARYGVTNFPVTSSVGCLDGMEFIDLLAVIGSFYSAGMGAVGGGINNKQRVSFTLYKNLFGEEEIARKFAHFFVEEIQELSKS